MGTDETAAEGFSRTAGDYDTVVRHNVRGAERLILSLPAGRYERVLDVGCGTGWASLAMLDRFPVREIIGVDPAEAMLDIFRQKLEAERDVAFALHAQDVMEMDVPDESFDAVISSMAFHWFLDKPGAMKKMAAALVPGGVIGILQAGRRGEQAFRSALAGIDPPVPAKWIAAFDIVQRDEREMEAYLHGAGLEPIDVWMEQRHRIAPVEDYLERMRVVASHLSADMEEEERERLDSLIEDAVRAISGPDGFDYDFTKLYGVARKPG